ncbi:MAG TPA: ferritin-like domain-containing protein, partial [Acidimicrobiales bacterium]|nr:ferritin-like domain-containing protein [Acidimicrobiales bacterium]
MTDRFEDQMEENASMIQRLAPSPLTRRRVLLGGGVGAIAVVAAACGSDNGEPAGSAGEPTTTQATEGGGGGGGGDLEVAKTAASLEVLAVNTYGAALEAPLDYPPAVAEFATTAKAHHEAHRDAWNDLLTGAGETEVTDPPAELEAMVNDQFSKVTDVGGVAALALMLEQTAADTYFAVIPQLTNEEAVKLAASIQPIDMQHAAILHYVMGEYPVPKAFATT